MITQQTMIILGKKPEIVEMAGEKVMADFSTGKYYMLKGAGNDIWDFIQSNTTVGEVKDKLLEVYDIDEATCLDSTVAFLEQLCENGFITLQER